ncbi:MAG TPA: hypothetical protein DCK76_10985 [Desulfotomaculum sp.]|nr:hypothetical protein [Desulfotomaculum sp.]HBY03942.1 hypothetical protein [Desulfotomaculum sp.]
MVVYALNKMTAKNLRGMDRRRIALRGKGVKRLLREGKIGVYEATCLVLMAITAKLFFASPRDLAEMVGPAMWLEQLVAVSTALVGFLFIFLLMKKFPGQDLVSVFETVFGKIAGSVISIVLAAAILFNSVMFTREFSEAVKVYIYPLTPPSMIIIFFLVPVLIMIYHGFETLARTVSSFIWLYGISIISIFILAVPLYKYYNLFPLFDGGIEHLAIIGIRRSTAYGDILILALFINSLQDIERFKKGGLAAVLFSGLLLIAGFLVLDLSFPNSVLEEQTIPVLALTRAIEFGTFFHRFESVYIFLWSISAILAAGINLYVFTSIYCKVFRIKDQKPLVLPLGIIIFSIGLLLPSMTVIVDLLKLMWNYGSLIYFGIPILALFVAVIRGKKGVKTSS